MPLTNIDCFINHLLSFAKFAIYRDTTAIFGKALGSAVTGINWKVALDSIGFYKVIFSSLSSFKGQMRRKETTECLFYP